MDASEVAETIRQWREQQAETDARHQLNRLVGVYYHKGLLDASGGKYVGALALHQKQVKEREEHAREVEKAREEQGFAKAREEAMAAAAVDLSQLFGAGKKADTERLQALDYTGLGVHHVIGEKHPKAKLTDALVQQLRREYWTSDRNKGDVKPMREKYGIAKPTFDSVISRSTWVHLPLVEGEPEENLKRLSKAEMRVAKKAKEMGVEPVRNKLGRLALPADVVVKLRAEAKAKKNAPAKE